MNLFSHPIRFTRDWFAKLTASRHQKTTSPQFRLTAPLREPTPRATPPQLPTRFYPTYCGPCGVRLTVADREAAGRRALCRHCADARRPMC